MRTLQRQLSKDRVLCLTYDDGPSDSVTPQLLDLLKRNNANATFFMLGKNAQRFTKVASRVANEHHDVGCHSSQHLNAWKVVPWRAVADIDAGYNQLSPWIAANGLFRPPHGKMTLPTFVAIWRRRAQTIWWHIDSKDTHQKLPSTNEVVASLLRKGGGIVLLHDSARSKERNDFVLRTTAALLEVAKRESFKIKRLSELTFHR